MKRRYIWLCLAMALLMPLLVYGAALRQGDRGEEVTVLQKKLRQWGYYDGTVDGIFGSGTLEAVKKFQRKNGLDADGIVGEKRQRRWACSFPAAAAAAAFLLRKQQYKSAGTVHQRRGPGRKL